MRCLICLVIHNNILRYRYPSALDAAVKQVRLNGWRGVKPRENVIKQALYGILDDIDEVERIFAFLVNQSEY